MSTNAAPSAWAIGRCRSLGRIRERLRLVAHACANFEIDAAALANEGLVIYSPPVDLAITALKRAREQGDERDDTLQWKVVSNRRETVDTLTSIGATGVHCAKAGAPAFDYLGFLPASA